MLLTNKKGSLDSFLFWKSGAGEESRTLDLNLGKVALYQLSYSRMYYKPTGQTLIESGTPYQSIKKEAGSAPF
jgi:hypothetical protein